MDSLCRYHGDASSDRFHGRGYDLILGLFENVILVGVADARESERNGNGFID